MEPLYGAFVKSIGSLIVALISKDDLLLQNLCSDSSQLAYLLRSAKAEITQAAMETACTKQEVKARIILYYLCVHSSHIIAQGL